MKAVSWILVALVAATALAGCTQQPPPTNAATVDSVTITRAPTSAPANSDAVVCWRVAGSGSIPHTAIHTDSESHPASSAAFSDYDGPAYYPNNASAPSDVSVPGEFCTNVRVGSGDVYLRAHAMRDAPGKVSDEKRITVSAEASAIAAVRITRANETAPPNTTTVVCWQVTGTGRAAHVALHTDNVTRPTATSFSDYRGATYYPDNATQVDQAGYQLPGEFCTGVRVPMNGTVFFRAHAMNNPPGIVSTERSVRANGTSSLGGVAATVTWTGTVPTSAKAGTNVTACIRVGGTGRIPHVAIHTDDQSHATEVTATFATYDKGTFYANNTTAPDPLGYETSGTAYCIDVDVPNTPGAILFMRGHAMDEITGAPGKLTPDEKQVAITA